LQLAKILYLSLNRVLRSVVIYSKLTATHKVNKYVWKCQKGLNLLHVRIIWLWIAAYFAVIDCLGLSSCSAFGILEDNTIRRLASLVIKDYHWVWLSWLNLLCSLWLMKSGDIFILRFWNRTRCAWSSIYILTGRPHCHLIRWQFSLPVSISTPDQARRVRFPEPNSRNENVSRFHHNRSVLADNSTTSLMCIFQHFYLCVPTGCHANRSPWLSVRHHGRTDSYVVLPAVLVHRTASFSLGIGPAHDLIRWQCSLPLSISTPDQAHRVRLPEPQSKDENVSRFYHRSAFLRFMPTFHCWFLHCCLQWQ